LVRTYFLRFPGTGCQARSCAIAPAALVTRTLSSIRVGIASAAAAPTAITAAVAGEYPASIHTPTKEAAAHASEPTMVFPPFSPDFAAPLVDHTRPAIVAIGSPTAAHQSAAIAALRDNTTTATRHETASQVAPLIERLSCWRIRES